MGLDPGWHFFARGSSLFLFVGKGLESLEVESEGREAKVEPPGSPAPHLYFTS